jgi:hypothetical protein
MLLTGYDIMQQDPSVQVGVVGRLHVLDQKVPSLFFVRRVTGKDEPGCACSCF